MGSAAGSLDDCNDQVKFWKAWNEATRDERHKMGVQIGKKSSELMKSKNKSATEIRGELATFVKRLIRK